MMTVLEARLSACFCSAASALAVFFWASFSARFCASTERLAVEAARASGWGGGIRKFQHDFSRREKGRFHSVPADHIVLYKSGCFF